MEKRRPLSHIRVVELSQIVAGPSCGLVLAQLGAEVIRVESLAHFDRSRGVPAPEAPRPYETNPQWSEWNAGKLGMQLNLKHPDGLETLKALLRKSDVFFYNMRQSALDRLGLNHETLLAEVNPRLIVMCLSGAGTTGPERDYFGYAPSFASLAGMSYTSGYPGMPPLEFTGWPDVEVGAWGVFATLSALHQRERTGRGTFIDLAGNEALTWYVGETFMDVAMNGRSPGQLGNRHPSMAPHGVYRCAGDEHWISIAVATDEEWRALCAAIGDASLLTDERFATPVARWNHQDALDRCISEWTAGRNHVELAEQLQAAGVAAVPTFSGQDLYESPHTKAQHAFGTVMHEVHGERNLAGPPWRFSRGEVGDWRPGPMFGEHNDYILREILGLSPEQIQRLQEDQALS